MKICCVVPDCNVPVIDNLDGSYEVVVEKFDVDGDGSGGNTYHDPDFQDATTYQPSCNADKDPFYVFPPIVFKSTKGVVMGCKSVITRLKTGQAYLKAFPGDVGPHNKIGEGSTFLAQVFDKSKNPNNGFEGEKFKIVFWPGVAAEGRTLQPYKC